MSQKSCDLTIHQFIARQRTQRFNKNPEKAKNTVLSFDLKTIKNKKFTNS